MPDSQPLPRQTATVHVLWARNQQFSRPQMVAAYPDGLVEAFPEAHQERLDEARGWFAGFGFDPDDPEDPWTFWETVEQLPLPEVSRAS
jgi:hypothetical protein